MSWHKQGRILLPERGIWQRGLLTPTPVLVNPDVIRIFAGFWGPDGRSRIGSIDVEAGNPGRVLSFSEGAVLDVGRPGCFDDNGLILGDVLVVGEELWMYYVGFQKAAGVKFLAFTGLARSSDQGRSFQRHQETPIMDRAEEGLFIRAIHTVLHEGEGFRIWYSAGSSWRPIGENVYPEYQIFSCDSADGLSFSPGTLVLPCGPNEYRIGRPRVTHDGQKFVMRFTSDTLQKEYRSGIAFSEDGRQWQRDDGQPELMPSASGWDSEMACYPVELRTEQHRYLFYSGNGMGASGLGYALFES